MTHKRLSNFSDSFGILNKLSRHYAMTGNETVYSLLCEAIKAHNVHCLALYDITEKDLGLTHQASIEKIEPLPLPQATPMTQKGDLSKDPWGYLNITAKGRLQPLPRFVPIKRQR